MNEKWMREIMDDVRMTDEKKSELWNEILRKADWRRALRRRMVAAAVILVLLVIPSGVYAATNFGWIWEDVEEKNEELDTNFKREYGSAEIEGFRFKVEQAFCDESLGIVYYYMSVTDVSDEGRDPREHLWSDSDTLNVGDVTFDIHMKRDTGGLDRLDEANSTDKIAYYYIESELSDNATKEEMNVIEITADRLEKIKIDPLTQERTAYGIVTGERTITIQNVIAMPSLTWKIVNGAETEEVRVSSIAARLKESNDSRLEIVLNDGKEIKDYFHYHQSELDKDGKMPSEGAFTSMDQGTEPGTLYRFDYTDIDSISGIRLDGTFYPVSEAKRSDE